MSAIVLSNPKINPCILVLERNDRESNFVLSTLCAEGYSTIFKQNIKAILAELSKNVELYQAVIVNSCLIPQQDYSVFKDLLALSNKQNKLLVLTRCDDFDSAFFEEDISNSLGCYFIEPLNADLLLNILSSYFAEFHQAKNLDNQTDAKKCLTFAQFKIKTLFEAQALTQFIAQIFPDPQRVEIGLNELMFNAIEHGNLGISYPEKSRLLKQGFWPEEISSRMSRPENHSKYVQVDIRRNTDNITVKIKDQGNGFEWQKFLELSTERVSDLHGRGIALAKLLSFDSLEYLDEGRTAQATVKLLN